MTQDKQLEADIKAALMCAIHTKKPLERIIEDLILKIKSEHPQQPTLEAMWNELCEVLPTILRIAPIHEPERRNYIIEQLKSKFTLLSNESTWYDEKYVKELQDENEKLKSISKPSIEAIEKMADEEYGIRGNTDSYMRAEKRGYIKGFTSALGYSAGDKE